MEKLYKRKTKEDDMMHKIAEMKFKFVLIEPSNKMMGGQSRIFGELSLLSLKRMMKKYYKELESKRDGYLDVRVIRVPKYGELRYEFETDNYQFKIHIPNPFGIGKNTEVFLKILEGAGLYRTGTNNNGAIDYHVEESMKKSAELKFEVERVEDFFGIKASWANKKKLTIKEILLDVQTTLHFFNSLSGDVSIEKKVWYDKFSKNYIEGKIRLTRTIMDGNKAMFDTKDYYITQPQSMPDSVFESIMGSLEKQIMGKMKRTAELKFKFFLREPSNLSGEKLKGELSLLSLKRMMKKYYKELESKRDGVVRVKVFQLKGIDRTVRKKVADEVRYIFQTDNYKFTVYISNPFVKQNELFLKVLEGAGLYDTGTTDSSYRGVYVRDNIKKSSIQKSAELKFKVSFQDEKQSHTINARGGLSLRDVKIFFNHEVKPQNNVVLEVLYKEDKLAVRYLVHKNLRLVEAKPFIVHKPPYLSSKIFKRLLESQGLNEDLIVIPF
jgi:hypothetical protein